MWIYRRIGKVFWTDKKTNIEVLSQLKVKKYNKSKTNEVFGAHKKTMKTILEERVQGSRKRGRQKLTWANNIKRWTAKNSRMYHKNRRQ
jgi:hypothetical protein